MLNILKTFFYVFFRSVATLLCNNPICLLSVLGGEMNGTASQHSIQSNKVSFFGYFLKTRNI